MICHYSWSRELFDKLYVNTVGFVSYDSHSLHVFLVQIDTYIFSSHFIFSSLFRQGLSRVRLEEHPTKSLEIVEQPSLPQEFSHKVAKAISR